MDRARLLLAAGLILTAALLLTVPYVPFQDIPNHAQLLLLDRTLPETGNTYLVRPETATLSYALYVWGARLLSPALPVDAVLRLMCVLAALALPLATARLAAALGGPWALTGLLALPLGLGWPLRMGFISFALGLPAALMGTAAAVLVCRDRSARSVAGLAAWAVVAYVTHAFAFGLLVLLAALAWMCSGAWSRRSLVALLAALVPSGFLVAWDAWHGAWLPLVGLAEITADGGDWNFRPVGMALLHVVSRSYGVAGPAGLGLYLPHVALLVAGVVWLAARPGRLQSRWLVVLGAATFTLGSVAFPDRMGMAVLLGPRANVIGVCFATVAAAAWLSRAWSRPLLAAVPVAVLAFAASATGIVDDARLVREVVGERPPRSVAGNVLAVHAADCTRAASYYWGDWDPLRHAWAYALSPSGVTPFLFARHRYDVVMYRVEETRPHPPEGRLLSNERALDPETCAQRNRQRVDVALASPGYDGVIVVGRPEDGERALANRDTGRVDRIAPGIWRLAP